MSLIICYVDDLIFIAIDKGKLCIEILLFLQVFDGSQEENHWYLAVCVKMTPNSRNYLNALTSNKRYQNTTLKT